MPASTKSNPRRYYQYRVVGVGGSMEGKVDVGDLTLDYWHGAKTYVYTVCDLRTGKETGWYEVEYEGPATPDQEKGLRAQGRAVAPGIPGFAINQGDEQ